MSRVITIIGESGTGKSTSIENLPPKETFLVSATPKDLPFKGWRKNYKAVTKENPTGNYLSSDLYDTIQKAVDYVDKSRPEIKYIVIDDFQYLMGNEFMRRSYEKGWEKFTEIGEHVWKLITNLHLMRQNLTVFILTHSDMDEHGKIRMKTIGKMLNEKINIDGMFAILLNTLYDNGQYLFETQGEGRTTAKTPKGMFQDTKIPNDLAIVAKAVQTYYEE